MAVIHDVMPAFELFQPASIDDALALLDHYGTDAWVLAGGLDSFDWLKDRIKRPKVVIDLSQSRGAARHQGARRRPRDRRRRPRSPKSCGIRSCATSSALLTEAAELVASPQIRNQGTHRRQRVAGHALLVLPRAAGRAIAPAATSATPTRRRRSIASTPFSTPTAAWR